MVTWRFKVVGEPRACANALVTKAEAEAPFALTMARAAAADLRATVLPAGRGLVVEFASAADGGGRRIFEMRVMPVDMSLLESKTASYESVDRMEG